MFFENLQTRKSWLEVQRSSGGAPNWVPNMKMSFHFLALLMVHPFKKYCYISIISYGETRDPTSVLSDLVSGGGTIIELPFFQEKNMKKHCSEYTLARQTTKHTFLKNIKNVAFYICIWSTYSRVTRALTYPKTRPGFGSAFLDDFGSFCIFFMKREGFLKHVPCFRKNKIQ